MVQTIAPRDSGGLTPLHTEQVQKEAIEPGPPDTDIHFDVSPNGAMPDGIPVEATTLQFEPTDGGFGDIFGGNPPLAPEVEPEPIPLPMEGFEPYQTPVDSQPAAAIVTQVSSGNDEAVRFQHIEPARVEESYSEPPPIVRTPAAFGGAPPPNGQASSSEGYEAPVLRRSGSRSEASALADFGGATNSGRGESAVPDTSFSDLAEAAGLRRNTGPVGAGPQADHSGAAIPNYESPRKQTVLDGDAPSLWSRLRWPVLVLLLLGMLATVGYFLGFQKWMGSGKSEALQSANIKSESSETAKPAVSAGEPETEVKPPDTPANPTASSSVGETPVVKEPETSPTAVAQPVVEGDVKPTHSLQAASFPSEAGAKVFAEKLIRAGVPAYVISVDIPRRGKWFRVRVGQFANAPEAVKYSAQARLRAKSAGINLDLMVCDYEKP